MKYETKLVAIHGDGTIRAGDQKLEFTGCNNIKLLIAAGTDYSLDYRRHYRGDDPHAAIERRLAAATAKGYDALKQEHIADYQSLFKRVTLDVGADRALRTGLHADGPKRTGGRWPMRSTVAIRIWKP